MAVAVTAHHPASDLASSARGVLPRPVKLLELYTDGDPTQGDSAPGDACPALPVGELGHQMTLVETVLRHITHADVLTVPEAGEGCLEGH